MFLFSFTLNAQENWEFKPDKKKHFIGGVIISIPSYYLIYDITNDFEVSRNAAWMIPAFAAMGKEFLDLGKLITTGKGAGFSFADFSYTLGGALFTTFLINKIQKRRRKKREQKLNIEF